MPLVSLKIKKEKNDNEVMGSDNEFPWGLQIHLHNDELEKLGLKEMPEVGSEIGLEAKAIITGVSEDERIDGEPQRTLTIQITHLGLFGEKGKTRADVLYGASKEK